MPDFIFTIEDTSPIIRYSSGWVAGTSEDSFADKYSESSFTVAQQQDEKFELDFYGSRVTIFGSKRGNHGVYGVQLDEGPVTSTNGSSVDVVFSQVLYDSGNITLGQHSTVLTNAEDNFVDVDYITFVSSIEGGDEEIIVNSFEDNHPSFNFIPASSWETPIDKVGWFSGSSGQVTTDTAATSTFTFQGDAVVLYGSVGPNGTDGYTVSLDGQQATVYSAKKQFYKPQEVLFFAANLGPGEHILEAQITSPSLGELAIDFAKVYTTASNGGSFLGSVTTSVPTANDIPAKAPIGLIVGIAFTSTLVLLLSIACAYLLWKNKRLRAFQMPPPAYPFLSPLSMVQPQVVRSPSNLASFSRNIHNSDKTLTRERSRTHSSPGSDAESSTSSDKSGPGYDPKGKLHLAFVEGSERRESSPPQYTKDR